MPFKKWRELTPYLVFNCSVFLLGALLFGIDTGSFGSLQALPSFLIKFGQLDSNGVHYLPATRKALMNSLPWIGKIIGTLSSERVIEFAGYKRAMYVVGALQIIGLVVELTAKVWPQFTVGRIVAYIAVGIVENIVPAYNAEISPAAVRGLLSGSLITVTGLGNLLGAGLSRRYATTSGQRGWLIPTAVQLVPAAAFLILVPFTPESPRWLSLKGRTVEAKVVLDKIRPKAEIDSGATAAEVAAIEQSIEDSFENERGHWRDIFKGNYLRRTWICATLFVFEQMNGNQFIQSYAATFYEQQGLESMSFTYNIVGQAIGVVGTLTGLILFDIMGRRPLFIGGSAVAAVLLYLASGIGMTHDLSQNDSKTVVASLVALPFFVRISASNCAYLTGAEIGGVRMRKKIMAFGTSCDVVAAFLVTFVTPYLLPSMGVNIGWIFGSVCVFCIFWGILFFPELKEVDELFGARLYAWQFKSYKTSGPGHALSHLQEEVIGVQKGDDFDNINLEEPTTKSHHALT